MLYCIKLNFSKAKKFFPVLNHCSLHSSILLIRNKELDSSVCESVDEISKQEIESIDEISQQEIESNKKFIKSQLTDIDYETYVKQF